MSNEYCIETEHVSFAYTNDEGGVSDAPKALDNISLSVRPGEYVAILGHNGSGKSTLAKLWNMILTPTTGKLRLFGTDVTSPDFTEDDMYELRRRIGMVFQNPDNQLVATVVEEDVAFGPENLALPREEIRRRVNSALATVGMSEYAHHAPSKLSGGQKQRVAIAGVLAMKPDIMIFDEATAMLDPVGRRQITDLMDCLHDEGLTVINITHYMNEAARAGRVIVINDGRVVLDGTPREIFSKVEKLRSLGLEVPQCAELLFELGKHGMRFPGGLLSPDECADAVAAALRPYIR